MTQNLVKRLVEPTVGEEVWSQEIFDYMKLNQPLKKADIIFLMGSPDTLPAERAADILQDGWSNYDLLVISGGVGMNKEFINPEYQETPEAIFLAEVAMNHGASREKIEIEPYSTNSGESIYLTRSMLGELKKYPTNMIAVHMPSAERRDLATINCQWPEMEVTMASPRVPWSNYHIRGFQGNMTRKNLIEDLLGDFQRLFVFPVNDSNKFMEFGFMKPQEEPAPSNVKEAYYKLVERGYDNGHLVRFKGGPKKGAVIPI